MLILKLQYLNPQTFAVVDTKRWRPPAEINHSTASGAGAVNRRANREGPRDHVAPTGNRPAGRLPGRLVHLHRIQLVHEHQRPPPTSLQSSPIIRDVTVRFNGLVSQIACCNSAAVLP